NVDGPCAAKSIRLGPEGGVGTMGRDSEMGHRNLLVTHTRPGWSSAAHANGPPRRRLRSNAVVWTSCAVHCAHATFALDGTAPCKGLGEPRERDDLFGHEVGGAVARSEIDLSAEFEQAPSQDDRRRQETRPILPVHAKNRVGVGDVV